MALRRAGWHVSGIDGSGPAAEQALALGAIDAIGLDPAAEVTFIATPVSAVPAAARQALEATPGVVTDVGSVKAPIVDAVGDRAEVLVDGGIRRGTHVLRALALGARAVLVGRPIYWALTLGGSEGVKAALFHLRDELSEAMLLAGAASLGELSRELLLGRGTGALRAGFPRAG